jgi:hypothetical protein
MAEKRVNGTLKVVEKKVKVDTEQRGVYHRSPKLE